MHAWDRTLRDTLTGAPWYVALDPERPVWMVVLRPPLPWIIRRVAYSSAFSLASMERKGFQDDGRLRRYSASSQSGANTRNGVWSLTMTHCGASHSHSGEGSWKAEAGGGAVVQLP